MRFKRYIRLLMEITNDPDLNSIWPYGWITPDGKYIKGEHIKILNKQFKGDKEFERKGMKKYEFAFERGWVRIESDRYETALEFFGDFITKKAIKKLLKLIPKESNNFFIDSKFNVSNFHTRIEGMRHLRSFL